MAVRTSYDDDTTWQACRRALEAPSEEGFEARLTLVDDPALAHFSADDVLSQLDPGFDLSHVVIVDDRTLSDTERPVLVVDLREDDRNARGRAFRVVPAELWSEENNLSLANTDFEEFADLADAADGVFRGF